VASLVIVALLFFVVSLVAAYTNRNLIFEQRTSVNQYRSTQAFEAAEAGIEWTMAMLNGGSLQPDSCAASTDADDTTFRERYLAIDADTGVIAAAAADPATGRGTVWPTCVFTGEEWECTCPSAGTAMPDGNGPSFRVRLSRVSGVQPGLVLIEVNGCTRADSQCLDFPAASVGGEGRATVSVMVALRSSVRELPVAAVTVREAMAITGAGISVYNSEAKGRGVTILAGGSVSGTANLGSIGGTPGSLSLIANDEGLQALGSDERMFQASFQLTPQLFLNQAGLFAPAACDGGCTASTLEEARAVQRGRILYVDGDLDIDADLGAADDPVMVVATGSVGFSAAATVHGVIYSRAPDWSLTGAGTVRGALIAENALSGDATTTIVYDLAVLRRVQWQTGTFVRVPGSWADFKDAP
jgi:Tfp pilus assembly protein PilX